VINVFSDGIVLVALKLDIQDFDANSLSSIDEVLVNSIFELIDVDEGENGYPTFCRKLECENCFDDAVAAAVSEPFFSDEKNMQHGKAHSTEYYNICCDGEQMNGYWINEEEEYYPWWTSSKDIKLEYPPWRGFHDEIVKIVVLALESGEVISPEAYVEEIRLAEEKYGFRSLIVYHMSKRHFIR
jgi:hypothetical protein